MKYVIYLIILLTTYNTTLSNIESDTLKLVTMPDDTLKCNLYYKVSKELNEFDTEKGLEFGKKGLELSLELNYTKGLANAYEAIGVNFWRMGIYDAALENHFQAISIYEKLKDEEHLSKCYNNLGLIYFARNLLDKAKSFLFKSISIQIKYDNNLDLSKALHNLALIFFEEDSILKSLNYHYLSLKYAKIAKDTQFIGLNYCFIGKCYSNLGHFNYAIFYLNKSLEIFEKLHIVNSIAMAYNQFAYYYLKQNLNKEAIEIALKGYNLGLQIKNSFMQLEAVESIYKAYKGLNDYKNAFKYSSLYYELALSMHNDNVLKEFTLKDAQYIYEKRIKSIKDIQDKEIYKNQLIAKTAIISLILIFIIAIILFAFYRLKTKTNKMLMLKNQEISDLNNELKILNSTKDKFFSIIAHDLKNPIGSFKNLTELLSSSYINLDINEQQSFIELLSSSSKRLYTLLENLLTWTRSQTNRIEFEPVHSDLHYLTNNVIDILSINAESKKIKIKNNIPDNTNCFIDINMVLTVLRNLISNAIKFTYEGGKIEISSNVIKDDKIIIISISDDGIGMSPDILNNLFKIDKVIKQTGTNDETGTGLGLILCKEFIEKHSGKIWAESQEGKGSIFYFSLPLLTL